jgi:hypothetical protein
MKNHSTLSFKTTIPDELKFSKNISAAAKNPTYIYTEEDLGEGILEVGVSA